MRWRQQPTQRGAESDGCSGSRSPARSHQRTRGWPKNRWPQSGHRPNKHLNVEAISRQLNTLTRSGGAKNEIKALTLSTSHRESHLSQLLRLRSSSMNRRRSPATGSIEQGDVQLIWRTTQKARRSSSKRGSIKHQTGRRSCRILTVSDNKKQRRGSLPTYDIGVVTQQVSLSRYCMLSEPPGGQQCLMIDRSALSCRRRTSWWHRKAQRVGGGPKDRHSGPNTSHGLPPARACRTANTTSTVSH